jgi:hypothetical protein
MARKHKKTSKTAQKRTRRRRYIDAIDPLREMLGCSAAEVGDLVRKVFDDNANFRKNYVRRVTVNY